MENTLSVPSVPSINPSPSIAYAYAKLKAEGVDLSQVHGTDRQWAIVRSLPQLTEEQSLQKLQTLATIDEGSDEWFSLRNEITEGNLYFAYAIASKYAFRFGTSLVDDVYQNASMALMQAIADYTKNGNGESWLAYAKTTICHFVQRHCITPHLKCGIKGGLNPLNRKHNAETNEKRIASGLQPLETVSVVGAETEDKEGNTVSKLDGMISADLSPLEALEAKEYHSDTSSRTAEIVSKFDAISQRIWQMRQNGIAFEAIGKELEMKPKACQMRYYTVRDKVNEAIKAYNANNL